MRPHQLSQEPWSSLLNIFTEAGQMPKTSLMQSITALPLEKNLQHGLLEAIQGDNRPLNIWLFDSKHQDKELLAWVAPVIIEGETRYAWMIGERSMLTPDVEQRLSIANKRAALDPLLMQRDIPPPLLFIRPLAVSKFRDVRSTTNDEFAIFQTKYRAATEEINDFHKRMALNCDYLFEYRRTALNRARRLITENRELSVINQSLPLYALLHSEGHNQGHFLGPWPYHENKECLLAEALEEFRSCLAAIRLVEHSGMSEREVNEFAFLVFAVRFFGYGFDAFCLQKQRRETIRELSVGYMFLQSLVAHKIIRVASDGRVIIPSLLKLRHCLVDTLKEIHDAEKSARKGGIESLRALATHWYEIAFPNQSHPKEALVIYENMMTQCRTRRAK